jgi:hypothetical protein
MEAITRFLSESKSFSALQEGSRAPALRELSSHHPRSTEALSLEKNARKPNGCTFGMAEPGTQNPRSSSLEFAPAKGSPS